MPLYHIIELTSTCWWKDMKPIRTVRNLVLENQAQERLHKKWRRQNEKKERMNQMTRKQRSRKKGIVRKEES